MVCSFSINLKVPKLPQNKNLHFLSHKHIPHNLIAAAVRTKDKGAKRLHAEYKSEHRYRNINDFRVATSHTCENLTN